MKILLVSPLPPPMGGIATLTERMINKLSSPDIKLECINIAHNVGNEKKNITNYSHIEPMIILGRATFQVLKKCILGECDIIHINSSSGNGAIRDDIIEKIAKKFEIPVG